MQEQRSIPRGLPPAVLDELSMLFSDHFARNIKSDNLYVDLNRVNWLRTSDGTQLPLFPPHLTPDKVFSSTVNQVAKAILMQWDNEEKMSLIDNFLTYLFRSDIFREVYERLHARAVFSGDRSEFERCFRQVWFGQYSWDQMKREPRRTCGFQHVYIGELVGRTIKGLHHWLRYYILEKSARLILDKIHKKHSALHIASLRFHVDDAVKPYGTIFFGLPIDFEIMLFFCAFLMGQSREVNFLIDGHRTVVISYDVATQSDVLATAFFKY